MDSALRITALGDTVTIQALSANGAALLELLDGALPSGIANQRQPNGRILTFPAVSSCSMKTPASARCQCLTPSVCCRSW